MKIETGREYGPRPSIDGKQAPGGTFRVLAVVGKQVKFEVLDEHRASAGGVFTMDRDKFVRLIEEV